MQRHECHIAKSAAPRVLSMLAMALVWMAGTTRADPPDSGTSPIQRVSDLNHIEQTLQSIIDENARLSEEVQALQERSSVPRLEYAEVADWNATADDVQADSLQKNPAEYYAMYDNGILI